MYFLNLGTYTLWLSYRQFSSQAQPEHNQTQSNNNYEEDIKVKILQASLPFVHEMGWSKEALSAGANQIGYPGVIHGMFLKGGADLVHYFQTSSNQKLVEHMIKYQEENKDLPPGEFVENAVKVRLEMIIPYISKWPQAIAIMSLPPNVPNSLASLLTMVDDICYYAGDRSVDVRIIPFQVNNSLTNYCCSLTGMPVELH